jgi:MoxR-like ATPase
LVKQLAAKLQRPYFLISGDSNLEAPDLVGMTVPWGDSKWQDGQLTAAIRVPGAVICLDEPSVCRPGSLFVFQNVLQNRVLTIRETGEVVPVAPGVLFFTTDNTNGRGGGMRRGYTDTNRLNAATIDRFGIWVKMTWLPADKETAVLVARTGCTKALAAELVKAANLTRAACTNGLLSEGLGLRRLIAWAELLTDGTDPLEAFEHAVINTLGEVDQEPMRQQCAIMLDVKRIKMLANNFAAP